ncbi:mechanosensitive ion channel [Streptomyces caniscabiei]|uniref:mechanosensitive ion channel family protein n=1 Tax=Streptomyces caniscabiei TaxID=2746961 RepID=UPI0029A8C4BA|nr:mechanosensitive ion channel domain-containing protein [Streptomyces caniscabiei]MDX2776475.1 mechanosensitive ion channel [Streptomyces caniscabiei]
MNAIASWINTTGVTIALTLGMALLLITFGTMVVRNIVRKSIQKSHERSWHPKDIEKRQRTLEVLFVNVWKTIIISIAILNLTPIFFPDVSLAPLFASAGIFGVALGFGAQSLVRDFLSGIFIISENQYRVGDIVDIEGAAGTVERIGTRSTVLRDAEGNVHYLPNGMVQHVINKTMGYSMARFIIDIHPSSDMEKVIRLINKTGEKLANEEKWQTKIIEAPSFVSVADFTSTNVNIIISGKTQPSDQWAVTAEMRRRLLAAFEKSDIKLGTATPIVQPTK